ncbi:MMPL family transporter [Saccharopolyspora shandongensis]|uniref:MMPL family transporter n=1 Tax=Saccharopolyspora shandongensis TaxID=418495 RepID=UPI0033E009C5
MVVMLLSVLVGGVWGFDVFDRMSRGGYEVPGSEAAKATGIAMRVVEAQRGDLLVVYDAMGGRTVDDPVIAGSISRTLDDLPTNLVIRVTSYWQTRDPQFASPDRLSGIAAVTLAGANERDKIKAYREVRDSLHAPGVRTSVAGNIALQDGIEQRVLSDLALAEAVSIPIVLILLVAIFGGVVAASLPVLVGSLAVFGSLGLLNAISLFADVNVFAINIASLFGLGLAIDYGLFIVGRFREELALGRDTGEAVRRSVASAGRTVVFSATMLIAALGGLTLFPQMFLKALAFGGISAVALAALISLTLLPAILGMLGHRVGALSVRLHKKYCEAKGDRFWHELATRVMKRPLMTTVATAAILVALGASVLHIQFGAPDERMLPANDPARQATEQLETDFPIMGSSNVQVVVRSINGASVDQATIWNYLDQIRRVRGIGQAELAGEKGNVTILIAVLRGDPYCAESIKAVRDIRTLAHPRNSEVLVGGATALNADSLSTTVDKLPWVAALLIGATVILLLLAFGSILLAIKAVVMSALSLSATFGALTWIFVEGHGASLLGVTPSPMEIGIVVLMASAVFGLSTDYEVLLLSRIVEARVNGASTEDAIRGGLSTTGRIITAAALLLIAVTGAFALSEITMIRFVGIGMILALLIDVTVIRMTLVPAVLKLMGETNWWSPGPLRRMQERVGIREYGQGREVEFEPAR